MRTLLVDAGAHLIAEHTVAESASGDGLVAVSFDRADTDLTVEVSHLRADDAIFPTLEQDLAVAHAGLADAQHARASLTDRLQRSEHERAALADELAAMRATAAWRLARGLQTSRAACADAEVSR